MPLPTFSIEIKTGNLGRIDAGADNVAALLIAGGVAASGLAVDTVKTIYSLKQAESLGITATYDSTNSIFAHYHIEEFFRENPNGELWTMLLDSTTERDEIFEGDQYAKYLINAANGRIKQLGVVWNEPTTHTITYILGTAIAKAEGLRATLLAEKKPLDVIFIEGYGFDEAATAITDIRSKAAPGVVVVVGRDQYAKDLAITDVSANHAAVGTVLGMSTNKELHESFAWADESNTLTDEANGRFLGVEIGVTNAADYEEEVALGTLHDKGFVFPRQYANRSGYYWNQSQGCVAITDDFKYTELIEVLNKAIRLTYNTLVKYINKSFDLTDEGRLTNMERSFIENELRGNIETNMATNYSKLSTVIIDPAKDDQNQAYPSLFTIPTLRAIVGIRPKGKAEDIYLFIGFTRS